MIATAGTGDSVTYLQAGALEPNAFGATLVPGLCATCKKPMADGGSPLPGEGKTFVQGFGFLLLPSCASCWRDFLDFIAAGDDPDDICHHGIALSEPCEYCDEEIEAEDEEVID